MKNKKLYVNSKSFDDFMKDMDKKYFIKAVKRQLRKDGTVKNSK